MKILSLVPHVGLQDEDDSLSGMYQCISELPPANRETLAAVVLHLQKVAQSPDTQMSVDNLAKVFGPTLVGHRSATPTHMEMLDDTKAQPMVRIVLSFVSSGSGLELVIGPIFLSYPKNYVCTLVSPKRKYRSIKKS